MKDHLFAKVIFLCLLGAVTLLQSDALIDSNLAIRFGSFYLLITALLFGFRHWWFDRSDVLLAACYVFAAISMLWSLNLGYAAFEVQRVLIYLLAFLCVKQLLHHGLKTFVLRALVCWCLTLLVVNGVLLVWSAFVDVPFASTSAHPNLISSLLFLFLPLLLYAYEQKGLFRSGVLLAGVFGVLLLILVLQTRSVWIATALFALLMILRRTHRRVRKPLVLIAGGFMLLMIAVAIVYREVLFDLVTLEERGFLWHKTLLLIRDHFWVGVGAGSWELLHTKYGIGGFDTLDVYGVRMQRPHNDFLWIASEYGLAGVLLGAMFFIHIAMRWWKSVHRMETYPLVAGTVAFGAIAFFSFPKERIEHSVAFFVLLALIYASSRPTDDTKPKAAFRWIMLPLCLASLWLGFYRIIGEYYAKQMLTAVNESRFEESRQFGQASESLLFDVVPGGTPISAYLAKAHQELNNDSAFLAESQRAYRSTPYNFEVVSNYGVSLNTQYRYREAEHILLQAHALNPRYDGAIFNLALVYYNLREYQKAKFWMDRVHFRSEITNYYSGLIHKKLMLEP